MVSGRFSSRSPKSQVVTVTLALGQKTPGGQGSILSGAGHTFPALHRPYDSGRTPSEIATRLAACALGLLLKARASFLDVSTGVQRVLQTCKTWRSWNNSRDLAAD